LSNCNHLTGLSKKIMTIGQEKSDQLLYLKMVPSTTESGLLKRVTRTEEVSKSGLMVQDTMVSGETVWPTGTVDSCMLKVMSMRENGLTIKPMVLVSTLTITVADMKVNGTKISNTDMVLSNGQMVQNMKANMNKV